MRTLVAVACVAVTAALGPVRDSAAQDLIVSNARIVDGKGGVIERGSVVVQDGKIVSVSSGAPARVSGAQTLDAQGRTLMPGFIDAHRHIAQGDPAEWLTTCGAADAGVSRCRFHHRAVRDLPRSGDRVAAANRIWCDQGPRLYLGSIIRSRERRSGPTGAGRGGGRGGDPARFDNSRPPLRPTVASEGIPAAETIKAVEAVASKKYDYIKTVITTTPGGPETDTLKLIVSEGKKHNLPTITHAVSVIDTLAAIEARPDVLVHTPLYRETRGGCGRREASRRRRNPDDVDAGGLRPSFQWRQCAALP